MKEEIEEILPLIVNDIANGVAISDPNQKDNPLIYINKSFERITGYKKKEVIGKNCRFLQGADKNQKGLVKIRKSIRNRSTVRTVLRNFKKNGRLFWNELYMTPIFIDKKLKYFVGIQNDITKEIEMQIQLRKYQEELEGLVEKRTIELEKLNKKLIEEIERKNRAQERISNLYERLNTSYNSLKTAKPKLTENEIKTYTSLIASQSFSVTENARKYKIPVSTVSESQKRFIQEKLLSKKTLTSPYNFELMSLGISNKEISENKSVFSMKTKEGTLSIFLSRRINQLIEVEKLYDRLIHIPIEQINIFNFFDFYNMIAAIYNKKKRKLGFVSKNVKYNESHVKVLFGTLKYPDANAKYLSTRIDMSVPTIAKYKKILLGTGNLIERYVPNPHQLGMSILVLRIGKNLKPRNPIFHLDADGYQYILEFYRDYSEMEFDMGDKTNNMFFRISENSMKIDFSECVKYLFSNKA